jgi:thiamine-phosphate pyrophosphorylase
VSERADYLQARLADARLYLCTDARERQGDLYWFLQDVLSNGVDIIQLRQKGLEAGQELRYLEVFSKACAAHGSLLAVNDRADVARVAQADVLHLGQDDLPVRDGRGILGPDPLVGLSSHAESQTLAASTEPAIDYFCAGPVWPTPTKAGRPAAGLELVRYASGLGTTRPWFAIGGIDEQNLDQVLDAGASRIVVVRAITEAEHPGAAAHRLAARLRKAHGRE